MGGKPVVLAYIRRFSRLLSGLLLYGLGTYLVIQANIGLAPWEAFSMGFALLTGLSFGDIVVLSGLIIVGIDILLKEKIGFGTLLNAILIGKFVDLFVWLDLMPAMGSYVTGIPLLLASQVVIALASFLYIGAGLGCGPRDALMVALGKRVHKAPIGLVRGGLEGTVLLIGWLLGAKVGLGTVIAVFGIGFIIQYTFQLLRFDVKTVRHENLLDTIKAWRPTAVKG
jgi:uncharacterized membrane protein YczE